MLALQKALGFFGVKSIFGISVGKLFGFADGGRPPINRPSIVGEKGPELFVPRTAGSIVPSSLTPGALSGGGQSVVINQNLN